MRLSWRKREHDDFTPEQDDAEGDFQKRDERATALAKEGQLSTACTALLDEPPASNTESVTKEERDRHPQPLAEDVARMKLLRVAPVSLAATPSLSSAEDAQSAIHEELLRDEIMRGLHSVGGIVARGAHPRPRRFLCRQRLAHGIAEARRQSPPSRSGGHSWLCWPQ